MNIFGKFSKDVGIDLGTTNTLIYLKNKGLVVNEPTIVAVNNKTGQIVAIGNEARKMLDRTPQHINVIKPLIGGVISDFEMTEEIIKYHLRGLSEGIFNRYGLAVLGVPTHLTEVERKSVEDAAVSAGASKVYLIEEPIAAALGARLPVEDPTANMIIDVGGGTTEIAIISIGGTVISNSLKIAGDKLNDDIIRFIKDEFKLAIGEPTAEELKISIGSAVPLEEKLEMVVRGRDLSTGLPKEAVIKNSHIRMAISRSLKTIAEASKNLIEEAPPELVGDILEKGVYICGGGGMLRGLDQYLSKEIASQATLIDDPLTCVVRGIGMIIEDFGRYEKILDSQAKPREVKI